MGETLHRQIHFYREQSEPWLQDHKEVMQNYGLADEFDELCAIGLFVFDRLKNHLASCNSSFDKTLAITRCLDLWYEGSSSLSDYAGDLQNKDFDISNLPKLRESLAEASGLLSDLQDASDAITSVQKGTAVTLQEFIDEL